MDSETNNNITEALNQYLPSRTQEHSLNWDVSQTKLSFPTFIEIKWPRLEGL